MPGHPLALQVLGAPGDSEPQLLRRNIVGLMSTWEGLRGSTMVKRHGACFEVVGVNGLHTCSGTRFP